jgi:hypothetical protein
MLDVAPRVVPSKADVCTITFVSKIAHFCAHFGSIKCKTPCRTQYCLMFFAKRCKHFWFTCQQVTSDRPISQRRQRGTFLQMPLSRYCQPAGMLQPSSCCNYNPSVLLLHTQKPLVEFPVSRKKTRTAYIKQYSAEPDTCIWKRK